MGYTRNSFYQRASDLVFSADPQCGSLGRDLVSALASEFGIDVDVVMDLVKPVVWEQVGTKHCTKHTKPVSSDELARRTLDAFIPHVEDCERRYKLSDGPFKYSPSL